MPEVTKVKKHNSLQKSYFPPALDSNLCALHNLDCCLEFSGNTFSRKQNYHPLSEENIMKKNGYKSKCKIKKLE